MKPVLHWTKNGPGDYSATTETGATYTAYYDSVSADLSGPEWKVTFQSPCAPLAYLQPARMLRDAKFTAQNHHDATNPVTNPVTNSVTSHVTTDTPTIPRPR